MTRSVAYDEAMRLHGLGWSVLPMKPGTKAPAVRSWKCFMSVAPDASQIRQWFNNKTDRGLAVVLGAVSGGLCCRDFDVMSAFEAWSQSQSELAQTLPQSITARGRHVFCLTDSGAVERLSPNSATIIDYGDGELRGGGLAVLPPSVHQTGHEYRWQIPPGDSIPRVDLETSGLARCWSDRSSDSPALLTPGHFTEEDIGVPRSTEGLLMATEENRSHEWGGVASIIESNREAIERAITATLPTGTGRRNKAVFELARHLMGIGPLHDASPSDLRDVVLEWHRRALPMIATMSPEETLSDFIRAWPKVRFPAGMSPLRTMFDEALRDPLPGCCERYPTTEVKQLIALCKRLQTFWRPQPFPLACRSAGELLEVSHTTASAWLFLLSGDGILTLDSKGSQTTRKASRYFYSGGD